MLVIYWKMNSNLNNAVYALDVPFLLPKGVVRFAVVVV